jgi:hypothetical protein
MRHGRRFGAALLVVASAPFIGGTFGVLLGFVALLVVADSALPMPDGTRPEAQDRFRRLVRRRALATRVHRLRGRAPERLDVLDEGSGWVATAERRDLGVQEIALDSVVATVEPLKAAQFDGRLRPAAGARDRWTSLWMAQARGAAVPPVSVYRVGDGHVLRDGHHRASVALDRGRTAIEAHVVELQRTG